MKNLLCGQIKRVLYYGLHGSKVNYKSTRDDGMNPLISYNVHLKILFPDLKNL